MDELAKVFERIKVGNDPCKEPQPPKTKPTPNFLSWSTSPFYDITPIEPTPRVQGTKSDPPDFDRNIPDLIVEDLVSVEKARDHRRLSGTIN
ncbi:hypothetical protein BGX23_011690 [Mortierella sp. AD031]|nr:hypothetical protein BGX23_011690 [Mortierella sp. AD031]